jgi:hypothetical protein
MYLYNEKFFNFAFYYLWKAWAVFDGILEYAECAPQCEYCQGNATNCLSCKDITVRRY